MKRCLPHHFRSEHMQHASQTVCFLDRSMSFLDNVFGSSGCNPDGTVGQNAFTRLLDATWDGALVQQEQQQALEMMSSAETASSGTIQTPTSLIQAQPPPRGSVAMASSFPFMPLQTRFMPSPMMMFPPNPYVMMNPALSLPMIAQVGWSSFSPFLASRLITRTTDATSRATCDG